MHDSEVLVPQYSIKLRRGSLALSHFRERLVNFPEFWLRLKAFLHCRKIVNDCLLFGRKRTLNASFSAAIFTKKKKVLNVEKKGEKNLRKLGRRTSVYIKRNMRWYIGNITRSFPGTCVCIFGSVLRYRENKQRFDSSWPLSNMEQRAARF